MPTLGEIIKDATGINEYQMAKRRAELSIPFEVQGSQAAYGIVAAGLHVATPLSIRTVEHALSGEKSGINSVLAMLIDVGAIGAIIAIANVKPEDGLLYGVEAKFVYNAWASVASRAMDSRVKKR